MKKLVASIRKLLLLSIFIIGFKRVNALCYARVSSFSRSTSKRVDSSKFLHSTRLTFARAMACSRVTSRDFLSNGIRNTESFVWGHLPLLNPASARRACNCAFLREMHINKWIPTRKSQHFRLRAGIISTTFSSK